MHFQWIHLHESKSPPFHSSDCRYIMRMALRVYSCCYRMRIGLCYLCRLTPVHSWTVFLVAVEYFQEESLWVLPRCRTCTGLKRNENSMSGRNGDRSRFY